MIAHISHSLTLYKTFLDQIFEQPGWRQRLAAIALWIYKLPTILPTLSARLRRARWQRSLLATADSKPKVQLLISHLRMHLSRKPGRFLAGAFLADLETAEVQKVLLTPVEPLVAGSLDALSLTLTQAILAADPKPDQRITVVVMPLPA